MYSLKKKQTIFNRNIISKIVTQEHEMMLLDNPSRDSNNTTINTQDVHDCVANNNRNNGSNGKGDNSTAQYKPQARRYVNVSEYEDVNNLENKNNASKMVDQPYTNIGKSTSPIYGNIDSEEHGNENSRLLSPEDADKVIQQYQPSSRNNRIPSDSNYEPVENYRVGGGESKNARKQPKAPPRQGGPTPTGDYYNPPQYQPPSQQKGPNSNDMNDYSGVTQYQPRSGVSNINNDSKDGYSEVSPRNPSDLRPPKQNNDRAPPNNYEPISNKNNESIATNRNDGVPVYEPRMMSNNGPSPSPLLSPNYTSGGIYDTPADEKAPVSKEISDLYAVVDKSHKNRPS